MPLADPPRSLRAAIDACNAELAWGLDDERARRYAQDLAACLPPGAPPEQIRACALNYHADHGQLAALRDALHPGHEAAWSAWMRQVLGVLRQAGLAWSDDAALDGEDLAQVARAEIARALPNYRYQSRFSTWAYRVAVQSVTRQIRRLHAEKRAVRPDSLERLEPDDAPPAPTPDPELAARGRLLAERVAAVLDAQPDKRLLGIFRQWAVEGRATSEIGALVRLHPSRVRALLAQARAILRADPVISTWLDEERPRDEAA